MLGPVFRYCPAPCEVAWRAWGDSKCWLCGAWSSASPPFYPPQSPSREGVGWVVARLGWEDADLDDLTAQPVP